ncbi:DUF1800 domain-containing protein [Terriglobus albidus]|uniref:DUF1800 domain-containing protein n=1 Tax=Terriglobus albidus TaxID=1592106 RepID=A0A5B9EI54_9BACT|nr:DUF1800 domain-containing protein [Terriglobus albidus]QEE30151.1 DUF1800 domain-containing protein [Terriglobus albidus]
MRRAFVGFAVVLLPAILLPAQVPKAKAPKTEKATPLQPLTERERAQQILNRFTFGARPGEVEQVLSMGVDKWLAQQLDPNSIKDDVVARRLGDYPVLRMTPDQVVQTFPAQFVVQQVAEGKMPKPSDPQLAAVYEVGLWRWQKSLDDKKVDADGTSHMPTPEQQEEQKKADQATAARIAGELFAIDRKDRMANLLSRPVADRAAFTQYVAGEQRNLLIGEFTPREREYFYAMAAPSGSSYRALQELSEAKMLRMVLSERQVQEVMTDFWFNHFNVYGPKDSDQWYTPAYERDAIRPYALGKFRDLLLATAKSPAMMVYLDNFTSIGPNSEANGGKRIDGKRNGRGLNENYAREVMELHTVGVNGGYSQADVTKLAAVLTGWSVDNQNLGGKFVFDPKKHEPGEKLWFGQTVPDDPQNGQQQGISALTRLASMPQTAHFISWKLAQRFVADDPPPALVDRMADTFQQTYGDIKQVLLTMVHSPEFNSRKYFRNKVKTPQEFLASAFRATATDPGNPGQMVQTLRQMGMPFYGKLEPTGYYITADHWMNTTALIDRLNFAMQLTQSKYGGQKFDSSRLLAVGLMSQPSVSGGVKPVSTPANNNEVRAVKIVDSVSSVRGRTPSQVTGMDVALDVLEKTLVGGPVSEKTNALIHQQVAQPAPQAQTGSQLDQRQAQTSQTQQAAQQQQPMSPPDTLNMLTALVLGSPEFQVR